MYEVDAIDAVVVVIEYFLTGVGILLMVAAATDLSAGKKQAIHRKKEHEKALLKFMKDRENRKKADA